MRNRVVMYLEEYARLILEEVKTLLDQETNDGDTMAGLRAKDLERRVSDIRRIVSYLTIRGALKD